MKVLQVFLSSLLGPNHYFVNFLLEKFGMSTKISVILATSHSRMQFSQDVVTLTLELEYTQVLMIHTQLSINFLIKLSKTIMVMDLMILIKLRIQMVKLMLQIFHQMKLLWFSRQESELEETWQNFLLDQESLIKIEQILKIK